ncbi:MAG: hypothetical protein LAP38_27105 [Acidobacteriia bacterium]|nr:hypothetical protein [Terriglobia bacterium]
MATLGITRWRSLLCCALTWAVQSNASVIVQLKVVEGEGMEHHTGSRATRGLTVQVTDETGKPVQNAAVSFRLPDAGATGVFSSGLRTEIVNTGPDGRATVWGMRWNNTAGPVEIRITAVKDQARAGIVSTQYLSDAVAEAAVKAGGEGEFKASHKGHSKWLWLAAAAGGAAAAGMAFGRSRGASPAAASAPAGISIGSPSINVGHP